MYNKSGEICGTIVNGYNYHYIKNIFGDILGLVDENGGYVADYTYDAWGNILSATASIDNSIRYTGYYYDSETDMYYCHTRYYVPKWLRWLNSDNVMFLEIDNIVGLNLFVYCENNPPTMSDFDGTLVWVLIPALLIVIACAASVSANADPIDSIDNPFEEVGSFIDEQKEQIEDKIYYSMLKIYVSLFFGSNNSNYNESSSTSSQSEYAYTDYGICNNTLGSSIFMTKKKKKTIDPDPNKRENQKKQGREVKNKSRAKGYFAQSRYRGGSRKPLPSHTPMNDHKKKFSILLMLMLLKWH